VIKCKHCNSGDPPVLECSQCQNIYCDGCQPYFDHEQNICGQCQEQSQIRAISEDALTLKMRKWFTKKAVVPAAHPGLPWAVSPTGKLLFSPETGAIGAMLEPTDSVYAVKSANAHHELSSVLAGVYNQIRSGNAYFNATQKEIKLWQRMRDLIAK
jgi:hypothetical protein